MSYPKLITTLGVAAVLLVAPTLASAQGRNRGHAVPRGSVRGGRPPVVGAPYRAPYFHAHRAYRPGVNLGFFYGRPGYFGRYLYGNPFYAYGWPVDGFGYPAYGYGYGYGYGYPTVVAPYGYGYGGYGGRPYGGVRIDLPQRDAEVFVDGYFVGMVDDFDGRLQQANLEAGPHRIEIRADGFESVAFDVNVEPGRTITYRASMRPLHQ
jgi:hypothetical protein